MTHLKEPTGRLCIIAVLMMLSHAAWPTTVEASSLDTPPAAQTLFEHNEDVDLSDTRPHRSAETGLLSFLDLDFESSPDSGSITAFSIGGSLYDPLLGPLLDGIDNSSVDLVETDPEPDAADVSGNEKTLHNFSLAANALTLRVGVEEGSDYLDRAGEAEDSDFTAGGAELEGSLDYREYSLGLPLRTTSGSIDEVIIGYTVWHRLSIDEMLLEPDSRPTYQGMTVEFVY